MRGQPAGMQDGVGDVEQRPVGAVTGPGQQLPGLRRIEVVQGHQDAGRCGDSLGVTQRGGPHLVSGTDVGQPTGGAFPVRHHGRVTRGEPRLVMIAGRIVNDGQALLSWIGVAWVVLTLCQLAVTVAGNMAVLPLTGVTFPFVSFGLSSLVVNMAFLALCINVNLPERGEHA